MSPALPLCSESSAFLVTEGCQPWKRDLREMRLVFSVGMRYLSRPPQPGLCARQALLTQEGSIPPCRNGGRVTSIVRGPPMIGGGSRCWNCAADAAVCLTCSRSIPRHCSLLQGMPQEGEAARVPAGAGPLSPDPFHHHPAERRLPVAGQLTTGRMPLLPTS